MLFDFSYLNKLYLVPLIEFHFIPQETSKVFGETVNLINSCTGFIFV